tara:strand:- start:3302 stop:3448 length:147 start_codon:yes stop_codon:yes gene_type:complete
MKVGIVTDTAVKIDRCVGFIPETMLLQQTLIAFAKGCPTMKGELSMAL